jgi:hypothetical protein
MTDYEIFTTTTRRKILHIHADQTFQVLRLPWMAEVLEPPGEAPVKTWKVSALYTNNDLEK